MAPTKYEYPLRQVNGLLSLRLLWVGLLSCNSIFIRVEITLLQKHKWTRMVAPIMATRRRALSSIISVSVYIMCIYVQIHFVETDIMLQPIGPGQYVI